ncbi:hypothetical protein HanXRQr2_Chr15g0684641 [Helianthus annuus]|uniref:Uncharacterized protein n=1 Tax=Helianthus annuus TaxID=4232 RepID=A0A9K3DYB2_HELAN|nr:hypothetical protein HanXRQr2_Chr15g0684641 [Helianthus annuus]KAJ0830529.1 hypothetical protein HanPSC8_Chr15g0656501 [Helianthus annuus]
MVATEVVIPSSKPPSSSGRQKAETSQESQLSSPKTSTKILCLNSSPPRLPESASGDPLVTTPLFVKKG